MFEIEVKCPKKKCKGYAEASVTDDEGNTSGPCDTCGAQVGFHYSIEIDGVHLENDE
jgi:hypothetical protein